MKANELRIGNLVQGPQYCQGGVLMTKDWHLIKAVDIPYFANNEDQLKGKTLTEEWLLKCGFKQSGLYFVLNQVYIYLSTDPANDFEYRYNHTVIAVQSVHQLQNLYFALTGEELTMVDVNASPEA